MKVKLGLIKGRHKMPVDGYVILQDSIPDSMLSKEDFYLLESFVEGAVYRVVLDDYPNITEIDLYLTGLSRVQHLVIKAFHKRGVKVNLYDFDKESGEYFKILSY